MAEFVVLEDFQAAGLLLTAGEILDDQNQDVDALVAQGVALAPRGGPAQARAIAAFRAQGRSRRNARLFPVLAAAGEDGLIMKRTLGPTMIYVDAAFGNDNGTGSVDDPLATLDAAEALAPLVQDEEVEIRVLPHPGAGYAWPTFRPRQFIGNVNLWVIFEDFAELISESAAAAGTDDTKVVTAGLVAGALNGKTVEILSGAAVGDRRTIIENTVTDIEPTVDFTAAVAPADLFRVIEPAAGNIVLAPADQPMVRGFGIGQQAPSGSGDFSPGLRLVNARIELPASNAAGTEFCADARFTLLGCELGRTTPVGFSLSRGSGQTLFGRSAWNALRGPASEQQASDTEWVGWGAHWINDFPVWEKSVGFVAGYVVAPRWVAFVGEHEINGNFQTGPVRCVGENDPTDTAPPSVAVGRLAPFVTPRIHATRINNLAVGFAAAIEALANGRVQVGDNTVIDSVAAILVSNDARIRVAKDLSIGVGTVGFKAMNGGRITVFSIGSYGTPVLSGNEVEAGNTPAVGTFAGLGSAGDIVKDSTDFSAVQAL